MRLNNIWYSKHPLALTLAPLSWLFCAIVQIRRQAYKHNLLTCHRVSVPVIIVGNITVGGTGKTPLVIWLGQFFKQQGFIPGIVSRGYGGHAKKWPQMVYPNSDPYLVGDEPVLLARHSGCPVAVAPRRIMAVQSLLENNHCNLIISDDGLQHYALHRNIEIAIVDNIRRYGNRYCLPAGPLREPINRIKEVNFLVIRGVKKYRKQADIENEIPKKDLNFNINPNTEVKKNFFQTNAHPTNNLNVTLSSDNSEFFMSDSYHPLRRVVDDSILYPLSKLHDQTIHAIAGIGHPTRFFTYLRDNGLKLHCHEFPDHHHYCQTDIQFDDDLPIIMTEKDAVKCRYFAGSKHWYLPVKVDLPDSFGECLLHTLKRKQNGQKAT